MGVISISWSSATVATVTGELSLPTDLPTSHLHFLLFLPSFLPVHSDSSVFTLLFSLTHPSFFHLDILIIVFIADLNQ